MYIKHIYYSTFDKHIQYGNILLSTNISNTANILFLIKLSS